MGELYATIAIKKLILMVISKDGKSLQKRKQLRLERQLYNSIYISLVLILILILRGKGIGPLGDLPRPRGDLGATSARGRKVNVNELMSVLGRNLE